VPEWSLAVLSSCQPAQRGTHMPTGNLRQTIEFWSDVWHVIIVFALQQSNYFSTHLRREICSSMVSRGAVSPPLRCRGVAREAASPEVGTWYLSAFCSDAGAPIVREWNGCPQAAVWWNGETGVARDANTSQWILWSKWSAGNGVSWHDRGDHSALAVRKLAAVRSRILSRYIVPLPSWPARWRPAYRNYGTRCLGNGSLQPI